MIETSVDQVTLIRPEEVIPQCDDVSSQVVLPNRTKSQITYQEQNEDDSSCPPSRVWYIEILPQVRMRGVSLPKDHSVVSLLSRCINK